MLSDELLLKIKVLYIDMCASVVSDEPDSVSCNKDSVTEIRKLTLMSVHLFTQLDEMTIIHIEFSLYHLFHIQCRLFLISHPNNKAGNLIYKIGVSVMLHQ